MTGWDMDASAGNRITTLSTISATIAMVAGLMFVAHGAVHANVARVVGGTCITMTALTLIAVTSVRRWATNTSAERARLAEATQAAEDERMRYMAAQAAMEIERQRIHRDASAERARIAAQLKVERQAMQDQFEEQRATLICETMTATLDMKDRGLFDDRTPQREGARVIALPEPARMREHARGRDVSPQRPVVSDPTRSGGAVAPSPRGR